MNPYKKSWSCFVAAIASFAAASLAPFAASSETIPVEAMVQGFRSSSALCDATPFAVWVTAYNQSFCIRYYFSVAGGFSNAPIVFINGDRLGRYNWRDNTFQPEKDEKPSDTVALARTADNLSRIVKGSAIVLARPGVDGSSGFHGIRKTFLELFVVNAALEAIKRRHGFTGFHLVGHSGGATLVGGLAGIRRDIGCAVSGSGRLSNITLKKGYSPIDPLQYFDASAFAGAIARHTKTRMIVVTDADDQAVARGHQDGFVETLRKTGGTVEQYYVNAADKLHHMTAHFSWRAAADCIAGKTPSQVQETMNLMTQKPRFRYKEAVVQNQNFASTEPSSGVTSTSPKIDKAPQTTTKVRTPSATQ